MTAVSMLRPASWVAEGIPLHIEALEVERRTSMALNKLSDALTKTDRALRDLQRFDSDGFFDPAFDRFMVVRGRVDQAFRSFDLAILGAQGFERRATAPSPTAVIAS